MNGLNVSNNTSLKGTLYVSDNVSLFNGLNISNNTSLNGTLYVSDNVSLFNGLNVTNNASFNNNVIISGNLSVNNNTKLNGTTTLNNVSIQGTCDTQGLATFENGINVYGNTTTINGATFLYGTITAYKVQATNFESIPGSAAINNLNTLTVDDFINFSNTSVSNSSSTILFAGTGTTTITNSFILNSSAVQINGIGTNVGIRYSGPFDITGTSTLTDGNGGFNYTGPINISTTGNSTFKYSGNDMTLYSNLRIKSGYGLYIEQPTTQVNISSVISEVMNIRNVGTGPALVVNQLDSDNNDIVNFQDSSTNVFTIGNNGNTTIGGFLRIGYSAETNANITDNYTLDISGSCLVTGNVFSHSDRRIKTNIKEIGSCLDKIENINSYKYNRIDLEGNHIGLIAQEVEKIFPELVIETNDIKGINYQGMIAILLNCIKELNQKIEKLEK
jgi:hypothetical protein